MDGDIIFQSSKSAQSAAVERATHSKYSHVGIIFHDDRKVLVLEAVQPVRYTPLGTWIRQGRRQAFVVKRMKKRPKENEMKKIREEGEKFLGTAYDLLFGWSDDRLYCSELVWKAYERGAGVKLGELRRLKDFDLRDKVVKAKLKERYGDKIPLQEPVISPEDLFDSPLLETVYDWKWPPKS